MIVRERSTMPHTPIIADVVIAVVGVVLPWIARLGLGRLPREMFVQREGVHPLRVSHDGHSRERNSVTDLWLFRDEGGSCGGLIGRSRYVPSSPEGAFATSVRKVIE
jgi:hypothetical protein